MSDEKSELRQRCSQLETDLRVCRAALAKAQEELAGAAPGAEEESALPPSMRGPARRYRTPKVAAE